MGEESLDLVSRQLAMLSDPSPTGEGRDRGEIWGRSGRDRGEIGEARSGRGIEAGGAPLSHAHAPAHTPQPWGA